MSRTSLVTGVAAGVATIAAAALTAATGAPASTAGASASAMAVTTYAASPAVVRLGSAPKCTVLRYKLAAPARDVDVKVADWRGREVWEVERRTTGVAAGVVHSLSWCGRARSGAVVKPGSYLWLVEAEQVGANVESRSTVRRIVVRP